MISHIVLPTLVTALLATDFNLELEGPTRLHVPAGAASWEASYSCVIQGLGGGPGAQGWSISVTADDAEITGISFQESEAAKLWRGGYEKTQLTTKGKDGCSGKKGAVSLIILAFTELVTLPDTGTTSIARITLAGTTPDKPGAATLRYADGCQGSGQPVQNVITEDGNTATSTLGRLEIEVRPTASCCDSPVQLGFTTVNASSDRVYANITDDASGLCGGGGGRIDIAGPPGERTIGHVLAALSSNNAVGGAQGWAISIALDGEVDFHGDGITTNGTSAARLDGFRFANLIDPAKNGGQRGAIAAVIGEVIGPHPRTGTETIADLELAPSSPIGTLAQSGRLHFKDGLRGQGQPVQNTVTVNGNNIAPCNLGTAEVTIVFEVCPHAQGGRFVRGDANSDGNVNVTDAVSMANALFRGGEQPPCASWADSNADSAFNLTDAIHLLRYLFQGGDPPPMPFPDCGLPVSESPCETVGCSRIQTACR